MAARSFVRVCGHVAAHSTGSSAWTYRTFALKRPLRLTWPLLYRQFGVDPARANDKATLSNFRADCLREAAENQGRVAGPALLDG